MTDFYAVRDSLNLTQASARGKAFTSETTPCPDFRPAAELTQKITWLLSHLSKYVVVFFP
jgi:hypothetical protein